MQLNVNISDEAYQVAKKTAKVQGHFLSKWIEQAILSYGKEATPDWGSVARGDVKLYPEPSHDLVVKQKGKRPRKITVREQKTAISSKEAARRVNAIIKEQLDGVPRQPKINIAKLLP